MKDILTYYELLDVPTNATTEDILKAYKQKVKEYHPDKNGGYKVANDMMQYLNQAKEWLTDPLKRLEYDYLIGVKKKPEQNKPKDPPRNQNSDSDSGGDRVGAAIALGLLGLIVGIAIGSSGSSKS